MRGNTIKLAVGGLAVLAAITAYVYFNRGYGETSELGYQYATALYSACNQADEGKLAKLSEMISASRDRQEISDRETSWLVGIIARGERGDWQAAAAQARALLKDQVRGM